ncbi:MAG: tetratricopeptide repeat protein [Myxococcota bacterium]
MLLALLAPLVARAAPPDDIAAALDAGAAEPRFVASTWLRDDPSDPGRWVALAALADDGEAEALLGEALMLDPDHGPALVALARLRTRLGRPDEARALLDQARDPADALAVATARADLLHDAAPARAALAAHPGDADAALAVARWTADPAEADAALAAVTAPDGRVAAARADRALRAGDVAAAEVAAALPPAERERLGRWLDCLRAGTVTGEAVGALWDARRQALATPGAAPVEVQAEQCPAALALRAAGAAPAAAVADLRAAVALAPADAGLREALGSALLAAGRAEEALPWLVASAAERPFAPPTELARAHRALGDLAAARAVLDAAAPAFPDDVELAALRADLAPDRAAELDLLVAAVARTHDPALLARARAVAEGLDRGDALADALRPAPLPPLSDDVSEEVVVVAKDSERRLREIVAAMKELGYGDPVRKANGDVHFATGTIAQPSVTLHPDGTYDVQRAGLVRVKLPVARGLAARLAPGERAEAAAVPAAGDGGVPAAARRLAGGAVRRGARGPARGGDPGLAHGDVARRGRARRRGPADARGAPGGAARLLGHADVHPRGRGRARRDRAVPGAGGPAVGVAGDRRGAGGGERAAAVRRRRGARAR